MKGTTNYLTPGERVAYYRRRRGYTREVLAGLVGKTVSWLEKIESGRANLQVLSSIAALASALDISPLELMPDDIVDVDDLTRGHSIPALRQRLLSYRFVNPRYLDHETEPMALVPLTGHVTRVWDGYQASRFSYVIAELHRLLPIAVASLNAAGAGPNRESFETQLAYVYQVASCVLGKVGEQDLAFTCADRGDRLIQDSRDLAAKISVQRTIAHALLSNAQYEDALAVVYHSLTSVRGSNVDARILSTTGTLHLVGAMTSARMGDRGSSRAHLDQAQRAATRLGRDGNQLWTAFGPTNVAIHEVAVAAEFGDYQRAVAIGEPLQVSHMPGERQVRHRLELARALHHQHQQRAALSIVLTAEQHAPDQVRRHFLTHALLHEWIRSKHVPATPELHGIARRAGILAA